MTRPDPREEFAEIVTAMARGQVIDGVPITSSTIGPLTRKYAEMLAAESGGDDQAGDEGGEVDP